MMWRPKKPTPESHPRPAPHVVFHAAVRAVTEHPARLPRSCAGTPSAGHHLAALLGGRGAPRPPGRAVDGGGHHRRCTRGPEPSRSSQTTHEGAGPDAVGIFQGRAPTPGRPHQAREAPRPSGAGRRRRGRSRPGHRASAPAPPPGNAPQAAPGHAWEGPSPPGQTEPTAPPTGEHPASRRGRDGPGAGRVDGDHGPAGPGDRVAMAAAWSVD